MAPVIDKVGAGLRRKTWVKKGARQRRGKAL
jgi:hypothetical protein